MASIPQEIWEKQKRELTPEEQMRFMAEQAEAARVQKKYETWCKNQETTNS